MDHFENRSCENCSLREWITLEINHFRTGSFWDQKLLKWITRQRSLTKKGHFGNKPFWKRVTSKSKISIIFHYENWSLLKKDHFEIKNFENGLLRKSVTSKIGHFWKRVIWKSNTSKMGHFEIKNFEDGLLWKSVTSKIDYLEKFSLRNFFPLKIDHFWKWVTSKSKNSKISYFEIIKSSLFFLKKYFSANMSKIKNRPGFPVSFVISIDSLLNDDSCNVCILSILKFFSYKITK